MEYQRRVSVNLPYGEAVARTREALAEQGFGILSEIDVQATLKVKRGLDMEPYVILGACNPDLAHRALEIDRGIGVLLPCNVVVSADAGGGATVRIQDPELMAAVTGLPALQPVADEASARLNGVLAALSGG